MFRFTTTFTTPFQTCMSCLLSLRGCHSFRIQTAVLGRRFKLTNSALSRGDWTTGAWTPFLRAKTYDNSEDLKNNFKQNAFGLVAFFENMSHLLFGFRTFLTCSFVSPLGCATQGNAMYGLCFQMFFSSMRFPIHSLGSLGC